MPAVGVDILILNSNVLALLRKDLQDLGDSFRSRGRLRKLFEEIRDEVLIPSIRKNFEVGGRPPWEPISQSTSGLGKEGFIASAASGIIGGRKPLTKSGQMKRAATAKARFIIRNNEMHYGKWPEKRWFGPVHNLRELSERAHIPNRPFTVIQREDQIAIEEITNDWIEARVNEHIRLRYA
ncbi:MAG: hypothetical protein ACW99G_20230 [Candidatus Thorarchaeota archaeon]